MSELKALGEFGLIARLTSGLGAHPDVEVGVGDDCAVLRIGGARVLATCDAAVEDVHFRRDTQHPESIGYKTAAAAISDIAAMGGRPKFALISFCCPANAPLALVDAVYAGLRRAAEDTGVAIAGGDVTQTLARIVIDVTVLGETPGARYLTRAGALPGDALYVTGYPGRSAAGLLALQHGVNAERLVAAHLHPVPRIEEGVWLAARPEVHAMIDVSDGLLQDAGHIAARSGLGVDIDPEALPVSADFADYDDVLKLNHADLILAGGEDYELAFAADVAGAPALEEAFLERFGLPATRIGVFSDGWQGTRIAGEPAVDAGYDHFGR